MFDKVVLRDIYPPPFFQSEVLRDAYMQYRTKNLENELQNGNKKLSVYEMRDLNDDFCPYRITLDDYLSAFYYPEFFNILETYLLHPHLIDDCWAYHLKVGDCLDSRYTSFQYEFVDAIIDRNGAYSEHDLIFVLRNMLDGNIILRTLDEVSNDYFLIENTKTTQTQKDKIKVIPLEALQVRKTKPKFHTYFEAYEQDDIGGKVVNYSGFVFRCIETHGTCRNVPSYIDADGDHFYAFMVDPLPTIAKNPDLFVYSKPMDWEVGTKLYKNELRYEVIDIFFDYRCQVDNDGGLVFMLENENLETEFFTLTQMKDFTDEKTNLANDDFREEVILIKDEALITAENIIPQIIKEKTKMKTTLELNKIIGLLNNYIVKDDSIGVSINGLSIDNRVWNEKEQTFYQVEDTTWKGITAGFRIPTDVKHIKKGDIIFTSKNKPLIVREILANTIKAQCPIEEIIIEVVPSKTMLGYKAYDLLVTPFNFQNTINPIANICVASAFAFHKGGTDEVVDVLLPQALPLLTCKADLGTIMQTPNFKWIAPVLLIALEIFKDKTIDFANTSKIKDWCREHKKETWLIVLAVLTLLYINKDKIANELIKERITTIPILGTFAEPIGKALLKMPKVQNKLIEKFSKTE